MKIHISRQFSIFQKVNKFKFPAKSRKYSKIITDLHTIIRLQIEVEFDGLIFFVRGFFATFTLIRDAQAKLDHVFLVCHWMFATQQFQLETRVFSKEFMLQQLFYGRPLFFVQPDALVNDLFDLRILDLKINL